MPGHYNNVQTNLYTGGGEFTCASNAYPGCGEGVNNTYIGYYHSHPEKGAMAGAEHSNQSHPLLTPVANRRKRMANRRGRAKSYHTNGCPPGQMMSAGQCVPAGNGMGRRGRAKQMSCPPGQVMSGGQCVPAGGGMSGGYRKRSPQRVKRASTKRTANRQNRNTHRVNRRKVATNRRTINKRRNIRRARQVSNPVYSGNVLYHCPPGVNTITSDCVVQRRK